MKSGLFDEDVVIEEAKRQSEFFNSVLGVAIFSLGLACIAMPNTQKAAYLCLVIVLPMLWQARHHFPQTIKELRDLYRETKDPHVAEVLKYLEIKYVGHVTVFTRNILFWVGMGVYAITLSFPGFSHFMKQI